MSDLTDITVRNRQSGVSGEATGHELHSLVPGAPFTDVVEALAFAGFPPYDTLVGSLVYIADTTGGATDQDRSVVLEKMQQVGYPQNEIDEAAGRLGLG